MKLAPVLAKYLSANESLNLPGFGVFTRSNSYDPNIDYSKKGATLGQTLFEEKDIAGFDDELLEFVSKETGKMKVLALSDLQSQLDDVKQSLNTGKPYYFNGMGTLTKKINGSLEFFSDNQLASISEKKKEAVSKENTSLPQAFIEADKQPSSKGRSPLLLILILTVLAIAAAGWFYFYTDNQQTNVAVAQKDSGQRTQQIDIQPVGDTLASKADTTANAAPAISGDSYKYVLEVAGKARAEKRFNQLKTIQWPVELEPIDSSTFRIIMRLPASKDSTRMKDSLRILSGRKVFIAR